MDPNGNAKTDDIITARNVDLSSCDRELIQYPEAIQPHGVLLTVDDHSNLILHASANCAQLLGAGPGAIIGKSASSVLGRTGQDLIGALRRMPLDSGPVHVARESFVGSDRGFNLFAHRSGGLIILELESAPPPRTSSNLYSELRADIARLQETKSLKEFFDLAVRKIRSFTGFDRVMAYRFDRHVPKKGGRINPGSTISSNRFILYSLAVAVSAAGLYNVSFVLVGAQGVISAYLIPLIYLTAMAGEGFFGVAFGLLYDKVGKDLVYIGLLAAAVMPFLLTNSLPLLLFAAALVFGAVSGIQDTVMRSVVGSMIPRSRRGNAYGIFNSLYGFGIMTSSIVVGYLYYASGSVTAYILIAQAVAVVLLYVSFKKNGRGSPHGLPPP